MNSTELRAQALALFVGAEEASADAQVLWTCASASTTRAAARRYRGYARAAELVARTLIAEGNELLAVANRREHAEAIGAAYRFRAEVAIAALRLEAACTRLNALVTGVRAPVKAAIVLPAPLRAGRFVARKSTAPVGHRISRMVAPVAPRRCPTPTRCGPGPLRPQPGPVPRLDSAYRIIPVVAARPAQKLGKSQRAAAAYRLRKAMNEATAGLVRARAEARRSAMELVRESQDPAYIWVPEFIGESRLRVYRHAVASAGHLAAARLEFSLISLNN